MKQSGGAPQQRRLALLFRGEASRGDHPLGDHEVDQPRRRALSAGVGAHFLPCFDGDAAPELMRLGARLTEEARDLWVLTLPELRNNSRIHAFMEHVHGAFKPRQRALAGGVATAKS